MDVLKSDNTFSGEFEELINCCFNIAKGELIDALISGEIPPEVSSVRDIADYIDVNSLGDVDIVDVGEDFNNRVLLASCVHKRLDDWISRGGIA